MCPVDWPVCIDHVSGSHWGSCEKPAVPAVQKVCGNCPAFQYSTSYNAPYCYAMTEGCPDGKGMAADGGPYPRASSTPTCLPCPRGKYSNAGSRATAGGLFANNQCTDCPKSSKGISMTTANAGSTDASKCFSPELLAYVSTHRAFITGKT
eukprot:gene32002-2647_t